MNRSIFSVLITIGGTFLAVILALTIFTSEGNVLGNSLRYLAPGMLLLGLIVPRFTFFTLPVLGAFMDYVVYLLYTSGGVYFLDEKLSKLAPPLGVFGIVVSLGLGRIIKGNSARDEGGISNRSYLTLLFYAVGLTLLLFGAGFLSGRNAGAVQAVSLSLTFAPYGMLIFVAPVILDNNTTLRRWVILSICISLVPCVMGIKQHYIGITASELAFMETQALIGQLELGKFDKIQAFGMSRSPGALATLSASMGIFCLILVMRAKYFKIGKFGKLVLTCVAALFFLSLFSSGKRLGFAIVPIFFIAYWTYRGGIRTGLLYTACAIGLVAVIIFSDNVQTSLKESQKKIYAQAETKEETQNLKFTANLATYNDRIRTFALLKDKETYTLFGKARRLYNQEELAAHSLPIQLLLGIGVVPVTLLLSVFGLIFYTLHRMYWRAWRVGSESLLSYPFFCYLIAIFGVSALGAKYIGGFPITMYIGVAGGLTLKNYVLRRVSNDLDEDALMEDDSIVSLSGRSGKIA